MQDKTAPARPAAIPLPQNVRMPSSAAMPAGRKHAVEALRIRQVVKLTTWNKRNGIPQNVTITASGHFAHVPNRNEKSENETFHFQQNRYR